MASSKKSSVPPSKAAAPKAKAPAKAPAKTSAKAPAKPAVKPVAKVPAKPAASPAAKEPAAAAKKPTAQKEPASSTKVSTKVSAKESTEAKAPVAKPKNANFLAKQRQRLLEIKDTLLDSMSGVAKDTLRSRAEGSEGSAFGMHQADAGSDAYDRDFALSLLSQEQNSLYEIDEALKRIEDGTYGVCEISGKPIRHDRLEALPFTRYTVECQAELEKQNRFRARVPVTSLFGLGDDEDSDDEDSMDNSKD